MSGLFGSKGERARMRSAQWKSRAGRGVAAALMTTALGISRDRGSVVAWLGVNQHNHRAQRFYTKMGFTRVGEKTFDLNGNVEHDYVLSRRL